MNEIENQTANQLVVPQSNRNANRSLGGSFACACRGLWFAVRTQRNFRIHLIATAVVVALGLMVHLGVMEWGLVIFAIGFVLSAELFNTAVERLGDEISSGTWSQAVKHLKDIAAAAVLISAVMALAVGIIIIFIPLIEQILD